jgi:hypothetical protein
MNKMDIKFKNLNNKSRKGLYLLIKDKSKSRYYKFDEKKGLDFYTNYFNKNKSNRINFKKYEQNYDESKQIPKKSKSKHSLEDIEAGINTIIIKNVHNVSQNDINLKIKELFSKSIKDKELLNLIVQESNIEKVKKRLSYTLNLYDEHGTYIGDYVVTDLKTPNQVINLVKTKTTVGSEFKEGYLTGLDTNSGLKSNNSLKAGYVSRFELQVTFVKRN